MLKSSAPPQTARVANDFFKDGTELLSRYKLVFEKQFAIKSWRLKCFIDLRMSCECFLKALAAYHEDKDLERKAVIQKVEAYRHDVKKLAQDISGHLSADLWEELQPYTEALNGLPVGLRYALDGYDFITAREDEYYATIGSDDWLDSFYEALIKTQGVLNEKLQQHSGVYSASAYLEDILNPPFNKYKK